ncbi:MAG: ABC transporter ATP-binding protein [Bacteroidota bacterium]
MIDINSIVKQYGDVTAVNIEALAIPAGESFGLVGNNGAGKTTLFRMLLDLVQPTSGSVSIRDTNVSGDESWKHYTGSYLDEGFLIDYLTPEEYFRFIGKLHGLSKTEQDERLEPFTDFFNGEVLGRKRYIRDLSKGNQKKVGIAAAVMIQPELLVLDEPFANLDPSSQIRLKNLLRSLQEQAQLTMLISSHDLNHVTEVCQRIVVLENGQVVKDLQTNPDTLQQLEAYFAV